MNDLDRADKGDKRSVIPGARLILGAVMTTTLLGGGACATESQVASNSESSSETATTRPLTEFPSDLIEVVDDDTCVTIIDRACRSVVYGSEDLRGDVIIAGSDRERRLVFAWVPPNVDIGDNPRFTTTDGRQLVPVLDASRTVMAVSADPARDFITRVDSESLSCAGPNPNQQPRILFCSESE